MMYIQIKAYQATFKTYVLGDDSIFGLPYKYGYPDLNTLAQHASTLGLIINPSKAMVTAKADELFFLGYTARFSKVLRPTDELIKLLVFTKTPIRGPALSFTRLTGLIMDGTLNTPELVRLYKYAKIKLRELNVTTDAPFPHKYANWLQSITQTMETPASLDLEVYG